MSKQAVKSKNWQKAQWKSDWLVVLGGRESRPQGDYGLANYGSRGEAANRGAIVQGTMLMLRN
jgi:hypothetical protein